MPDHTPGPWGARFVGGAGLEIFADLSKTLGKDFAHLVSIYSFNRDSPQFMVAYERWVQFPTHEWNRMQRANAQLVATAPELLEALQKYEEWASTHDANDPDLAAIRQQSQTVIAKATDDNRRLYPSGNYE